MSHADVVAELRSLEPELIRIGDLAPQLRAEVEITTKSVSGDAEVDVVTAADMRLQLEFLRLFATTSLAGCRLWAEESSPELSRLAEGFRGDNGLYLCLDPIDGTKRFVENAPYYSSIVSLHDGLQPLYSWIYYPRLPWWVRVDENGMTSSGDSAGFGLERLDEDLTQVVVYTAGDPDRDCPEWRQKAEGLGFRFVRSRDIGPYGAKYLLLRQKVAGYFVARPNPYDGLLAYHVSQAQGWPVWSTPLDQGFTHLEKDARGWHYPWAYLSWRDLKAGGLHSTPNIDELP